jgi:hypothetical protein
MCRCADVQIPRVHLLEDLHILRNDTPKEFAHLHICTFSHSHILTFSHLDKISLPCSCAYTRVKQAPK